jgi:hypothetical protein
MTGNRLIICARLAEANGIVVAAGKELDVDAMPDALVRLALRKATR